MYVVLTLILLVQVVPDERQLNTTLVHYFILLLRLDSYFEPSSHEKMHAVQSLETTTQMSSSCHNSRKFSVFAAERWTLQKRSLLREEQYRDVRDKMKNEADRNLPRMERPRTDRVKLTI